VPAQPGDEVVTIAAERLDGRERLVPVRDGGARHRLGDRGQVIRQPHQQERVDHGRVGGEIAEPGARGGEGL
jgi:hypothetical protein